MRRVKKEKQLRGLKRRPGLSAKSSRPARSGRRKAMQSAFAEEMTRQVQMTEFAFAEELARVQMSVVETAQPLLEEARRIVGNLGPEDRDIGQNLSVPEIIAIARAAKKRRRRGAPGFPNKFAILDACARAKFESGHYSQIAARFGKTRQQLRNLVDTHNEYFKRKLAEFTTAAIPQ